MSATAANGLGRLQMVKEQIAGFSRTCEYDHLGRERCVASRLGGETRHERTTYHAHGRLIEERLGDGGLTRVLRRDGRTGRLLGIQTTKLGGEELQDLSMDWDVGGNLETRTDGRGGRSLTETFKYDALDRLYQHQVGSGPLSEIKYDGYGNIRSRTGVGTYTYSKSHPGRLDRVAGSTYAHDANGNVTSGGGRSIEYASHDLPTAIQRGLARSEFAYGPDRERLVRRDVSGGELLRETWHLSGVERTRAADGSVELKRFLPGGAMETVAYDAEGAETGRRLDYLLSDHLGSVMAVVEGTETASGQTRWDVREERAFDPWGGCRDPDTWKACATGSVLPRDDGATRRGFTGHETLGAVGLVHMNGRIYDPALGRFLQADPYVQSGSDLQGLNRYAYVLNNPLNAVDPSGHFVFTLTAVALTAKAKIGWVILAATLGGFADAMVAGADFGQALRAGLMAGVTAAAFSAIPGTLTAWGNIGDDLVRGAVFGFVGGVTSVLGGGRFGHGFLSAGLGAGFGGPLADGLAGLGMGDVTAGTVAAMLIGGTSSAATGGKFANGAAWAALSSVTAKVAAESTRPDFSKVSKDQRVEWIRDHASELGLDFSNVDVINLDHADEYVLTELGDGTLVSCEGPCSSGGRMGDYNPETRELRLFAEAFDGGTLLIFRGMQESKGYSRGALGLTVTFSPMERLVHVVGHELAHSHGIDVSGVFRETGIHPNANKIGLEALDRFRGLYR